MIYEEGKKNSDLISDTLKAAGYEIYKATGSQEATQLLNKIKIGIVLIELTAPSLKGLDFLMRLKPKESMPESKVIVISKIKSQNIIDKTYEHGADKYIVKTWTKPERLIKLIKETYPKKNKNKLKLGC